MGIKLTTGVTTENEIYTEVIRHYKMAQEDIDVRISDWNKKDELFRSHIDKDSWPFSAVVFDPRTFTAIYEKAARLLSNKPKGRLVPRESGDVLGAKINNEILSFQWDESERISDEPMLSKYARMDMNARKYGASFALCNWHYQFVQEEDKKKLIFDGPNFKPWNNRDVLHNPSYSTIKNWIQLREYVTFDELTKINDFRGRPRFKNLNYLRQALDKDGKGGGDRRSTNWQSKNLSVKGLEDKLGEDPVYKTIEVVTEYRNDRWITFAPRHGLVLRDISNPYLHRRIPVIILKYYPIDEDIYGLSEIEPIEKLQRATNALVCQYLDAINLSLYAPLKIRAEAVEMETIEFGMGSKWIMQNPQTDVLAHQSGSVGVNEFASTYRFLVSAMQEALGETSASVSRLDPGESKRTATEIRETSSQRNVRDNFNQMFLSEMIKDQMMLWHKMNQQFLFMDKRQKYRVIRIIGQETIADFEKIGLNKYGIDPNLQKTIEDMSPQEAADLVTSNNFNFKDTESPLFGIKTEAGSIPKFVKDVNGNLGYLVIEPEDMDGEYDYIPDVKSMETIDAEKIQGLQQLFVQAKDPNMLQLRLKEKYKINLQQLEKDLYRMMGLKDSDKYFEPLTQDDIQDQSQQTGGEFTQGGVTDQGNGINQRMETGAQAIPREKNPQFMA